MKYKFIKQKALLQIFLVISLSFYTSFSFAALNQQDNLGESKLTYFDLIEQNLLQSVDAADKVCCKKTSPSSIYNGATCVYTEATNCDPTLRPEEKLAVSCLQTDYCEAGVCKLNGACSDNVEKGKCIEQGGTWNKGTSAEDPQCKVGCCDLPSGASITTQAQCLDKIKSFPDVGDVNDVFKPQITDQVQCLQQSRISEEGCCVLSSQNQCKFQTAKECSDAGGEFQGKGVLCSKPGLNCQVTPKQSTACYQNKVYWEDSAGNRENVYDGNFNPTWEYTNWLQYTDIEQIDRLAGRNPQLGTAGNINDYKDVNAMVSLAGFYERGHVDPNTQNQIFAPNYPQAIYLYERAIRAGCFGARILLQQMYAADKGRDSATADRLLSIP